MPTVYIALGSNLCSPITQLETAIATIAQDPELHINKVSPFYCSKPLGPQNQADFINAVVECRCELTSPVQLLRKLQAIEDQQGRERTVTWGPRTIDLDILLFDNSCMESEQLTLPHREMHKRAFVIKPLFDIAPELILPDNTPLLQILENLPPSNLVELTPV